MTGNEMGTELELKADRLSTFGSPGYEDFELTSVLTEAQHQFKLRFYNEMNNRTQRGFQETEARRQGFSALIKSAEALTQSTDQVGVLENGVFYDLPSDFMYTLYEIAEIDKDKCFTTTPIKAEVFPIAFHEISRYKTNKYKKPYYKESGEAKIWRVEFSQETSALNPAATPTAKRHELITDGTFAVTDYSIRYLKNLEDIVVDRDTPANQRNCELDVAVHPIIVDIAVDLLMNRVKEQKAQNIEGTKDLE